MTDTTAFPAPQPPSYGPPPAATAAPTASTSKPPRTRLQDIVFGWRAALAVLLAGIIVGGLVGASITLLIDHGSGRTVPQFNGGGFGQRFGGAGGAGGTVPQFGGQPGSSGQSGSGQAGSSQSGSAQSGQAQGSEFFG